MNCSDPELMLPFLIHQCQEHNYLQVAFFMQILKKITRMIGTKKRELYIPFPKSRWVKIYLFAKQFKRKEQITYDSISKRYAAELLFSWEKDKM